MLDKLVGPFLPYILGASVAAIAVLSGLLWWSNNKYDSLLVDSTAKIERAQANADQFEQTTNEQKATITQMLIDQGRAEARAEFRTTQLTLSQKSLDEERRKNEDYESRWAKVANKKPKLLSRIINRATNKRVQFFSFATCRAGCDQDRNQNNGSEATTETGPDSSE